MTSATLLFILVAILFTALGIRRESPALAWLGGLMVALGLGSIWPNWDAATRNALNATGANLIHWLTSAFTSFSFGTTSVTTTIIILLIGALVIFFTLSALFPHFLGATAGAFQTQANIIRVWLVTAY